jgi:hypothetical protein
MPFVNGCFVSRKEIGKDEQFLQGQGLSQAQISSISLYFQQRIIGKSNYTAIWLIASFLIIGTVSYQFYSNYIKEEDSKKLCIQNPFLQRNR